ncbi:MAG: hypothetical protein POELPBGB_00934 [Bacteroidia bacterium]|nr:hypothetical protein [Bacteroidia bacterium]
MRNKITSLLLTSLLFLNLATAQTGKDAALETLGSSSGLLLYNTYLAIGAVSDAYVGECYKAELTIQLAQEQINTADLLIEQYKMLSASGFLTDPSDISFVEEITATFGHLKNQAVNLKAFAETGSATSQNDYEYNRGKAWEKISKLLGLGEGK